MWLAELIEIFNPNVNASAGAAGWAGWGEARGGAGLPSRLGSAASHGSATLQRGGASELLCHDDEALHTAPRSDSTHQFASYFNASARYLPMPTHAAVDSLC